jgi:hypothetical protein
MTRRLARLRITTDLIIQWLTIGTPGFHLVVEQLPLDSRIVEARIIDQIVLVLTIESSEFPPVDPFGFIPWVNAPVFRGPTMADGYYLKISPN